MTTHDQQNFESRLQALIYKNLHLEQLDNTFLAREMFLSEAQFYRLVKKHFNISPNTLIRQQRLCEAHRRLVRSSNLTVREVAYSVGFTHVGYFIRRYEELFGSRPGQRAKVEIC